MDRSEGLVTPVWLYNDNVSQWTTTMLLHLAFSTFLHICFAISDFQRKFKHPLSHPSAPHLELYSGHAHLYNIHQSTMWAPGVFYQSQRGETTCEMRHYIIGVTRSHADHHLRLDTTPSSLKSFNTPFKTPYFRYLQTIRLSMKCNTNWILKRYT